MKNSNRKEPPKFTKQSPLGSAIPKAPQNLLMCPHRSEFNTYTGFHPPKHLLEDERSFSRNVASLKNMIQDKTNCSFESNQHTETTNQNIFRFTQLQHWLLFLEHNWPTLRSQNSNVAGLLVPMGYDCVLQLASPPVLLILSDAGSSSSFSRI